MAKGKLDKDGFILPLAIGALALLFFAYYFFVLNNKNIALEPPIRNTRDLDKAAQGLDSQNLDSFTNDLNSNTTDAANF